MDTCLDPGLLTSCNLGTSRIASLTHFMFKGELLYMVRLCLTAELPE